MNNPLVSKISGPINVNVGEFKTLKHTGTVKLEVTKIEDKILSSPFDFVNYIEAKIPDKEYREQKDLFPLKIYESEKTSKYSISELNPQDNLASIIYTEEKNPIFSMAIEDKLIFSDQLGNIKFYSFKEKKITKILQYPLKNTPQRYKSYSMDISKDESLSFVGYENGEIAVFDKTKCKQIIKTGNTFNILSIKLIHETKKPKQFLLISSDAKGNVITIILKGKSFGNFEEKIVSLCQTNPNTPYYLNYLLKFKEGEITANKSLNELNDTFVLANSENVVLYSYNNEFKKLYTFNKPKYIKENCLPDVLMGLGKQPSNNESTEGDADLLVLLLISWEKVIYLNVLPVMNRTLEDVIPSGYYVNEASIIRIGFLNLSTVYLIDKEGNFKILNTRRFNQGYVNIDETAKIPIAPMFNQNAEIQSGFKIDKIKSLSCLNNKNLLNYLNSIVNNRTRNEFFAFTDNTIYQQGLINYQQYLEDLLQKGEWNDLFLLGINIYKGKMNALNGIPIKIEERKKKVKEYIQNILSRFLKDTRNELDKNMDKLIEFCLEVDLSNFLFEKVILIYDKKMLLEKLEPFIICNKLIEIDVPKNIILDLINLYCEYNDLEKMDKLDQLLIHFSIKSLNHSDIKKKIEELSLISPQIYLAINDPKQKDYFKPVTIIYEKYTKSQVLVGFTNYVDLVKTKKMSIHEIKNCKQYIGHKLLWYLQKTLDGKKFPNFIETINGIYYYSAITDMTYWLLNKKVFDDLILLEISIFFNIINYIFSNEDILEALEENNDDKEKKLEALNILKADDNKSYTSANVDTSDLISHIVNISESLLNSKIDDKKKEKINLYTKIFVIIVGKKIKLDKEKKKEAIKFVMQNSSKFNIKMDISKSIIGILEGKDFEIKDYDEILLTMTKGMFDEIRLFILKKKKLYIDCLSLLLDPGVNIDKIDEMVFTFINMTLTRMQIKKLTDEYKSFKKEVKNNLITIANKSLENCYTIINFWFPKDKKDCVNALRKDPQMQLNYIEYTIKKIIKVKESNDTEFDENEDYIKSILSRHVQLLCKLNKKKEILPWLKKLSDYPIKECIDICKDNKVFDCLIFLYKKEGNTTEALKICYDIIDDTFDKIKDIYRAKSIDLNLYNSTKDEFVKFIEDTIGTIEFEENSYDKKNTKDNKHELWSDLLKRLYNIQNKFLKESQKEKEKIFAEISELILNQIQKLITRMSPFVGEKNVFDFVLKVNPKAKVIEFKPFFNETLKRHGIEIYILNFYLDSLAEYSLGEANILQEKNTNGENFELNKDFCDVCKNNFDSVNMSAKIVRFKCQHMQHINCCTKKKVMCLKCMEKNYKKWNTKIRDEKSKDADEMEFVEFLNSYKMVKEEIENKEKKERKEIREKKKGSGIGFNKKFSKLNNIENYNRKNRKNFILEGVKFYMEKK